MQTLNGNAHEEGVFDVLWPLSRRSVRTTKLAPRVLDLNDKTICELWDAVYRGDAIYPIVREYMKVRFPRAKFVDYSLFGDFHGAYERSAAAALPEYLRNHRCDAVIVGVAA